MTTQIFRISKNWESDQQQNKLWSDASKTSQFKSECLKMFQAMYKRFSSMFTLLPDECDFFFLLTELKEVQITLSNAFFDTNNVFFPVIRTREPLGRLDKFFWAILDPSCLLVMSWTIKSRRAQVFNLESFGVTNWHSTTGLTESGCRMLNEAKLALQTVAGSNPCLTIFDVWMIVCSRWQHYHLQSFDWRRYFYFVSGIRILKL